MSASNPSLQGSENPSEEDGESVGVTKNKDTKERRTKNRLTNV